MGYNPPNPDVSLVHYTLGGPYFDEHRDCEYAAEGLAKYKRLARVVFTDAIPRSPQRSQDSDVKAHGLKSSPMSTARAGVAATTERAIASHAAVHVPARPGWKVTLPSSCLSAAVA